jgi:sulfite exporter TauE/SafE
MLTLGLVTSIHCISMCGPMVVTYAVKGEENGPWYRKLVPNVAYQAAKITSYVIVGLALGAIGSAFNLDGVRPYIMLVAGAFMIIMGLGMTGKAPWAAKLTPRPPKFLMQALQRTRRKANADAEAGESSLATPITFGLLTGLMPCAPLMAAELAAAGTGSVLYGGLAMFAFGLGTSPLMLAFGTASSLLPVNMKKRLMSVLAIVVIVFGGVYLNRAAMRLGSPVTFDTVKNYALGTSPTTVASAANYKTGADGVVEVPLTIANTRFEPAALQIPADKPVRLIVDRKEAGACSDQLSIPQFGVTADLKPNGVTTIDIPAHAAGNFTLTCGMGMMSGSLTVGTPQVASSGASSPLPWLMFTIAAAGAALWAARRPVRSGESVPAPAHAESNARPASSHGSSRTGGAPARRQTGRPAQRGSYGSGQAGAATAIAGFTRRQIVVATGLMGIAVILGLALGRGVVG